MGGNGFYKYRCKYFMSHNCPNWVWVANSPCASCLADGRENEQAKMPAWATISRDIVAPRVRDGVLQYVVMELVPPTEPGETWTLRDKAPPAVPVTSAMPDSTGLVSSRT
ncbi:hypothetical protein JDV02_006043 [Purpureocillium takamizusanense]|uniref:Uncharacterized protein n=2 Tax=Purpureocillium TaxID=1052105 RepID=A0A9Q8QFJ5_9HYPO|nr:uncharacterized protein JDV02_006043 [Purpureocillium takamizusanense]UNI19899.1 hypothetical protein JDV02_006043 [Purpureocillium takamizusanense]GJN74495.1 hypothetical protein PLICBS_008586 [Purpureocillium lilacinum]GJN85015.1 hypothetical protein PLIIFM63780_008579 [Purpureocillium lilacinum]